MQIKDQDYVQQHGIKQPRWFVNFKTTLIVHLQKNFHIQALLVLLKTSSKKACSKQQVNDNIRHLLYFNLQSSLSFNEYPKLLATANNLL